jgi:hypothetical protein
MLKVEYLLKISRMSDVHMPTSGPLFSTSTQPQARDLRGHYWRRCRFPKCFFCRSLIPYSIYIVPLCVWCIVGRRSKNRGACWVLGVAEPSNNWQSIVKMLPAIWSIAISWFLSRFSTSVTSILPNLSGLGLRRGLFLYYGRVLLTVLIRVTYDSKLLECLSGF